ncbi:MAG: LysR family transcriptional regulator [Caldilineaceae bacterium]|nr:LysR family transcriptional regulator [Caldilineaceae bacterium]
MELRQLKTFRTTAQVRSFSRAAEILDYAQSTVSTQIQSLEQELGVHLFDRLGKQVMLTNAGQRLLVYADQILKLSDEAYQVVADSEIPAGTLTIGAPESLCVYRLPPVLRRYRDQYPQVRIALQPGSCPDLRRATREGDADVVFTLEPAFQSEELRVEILRTESVLLLAHPDHLLAKQPEVYATDLKGEPVLLTEATCSYRRLFEDALAQADVRPVTELEFNSVEAIKQCVIAGMGIAVLPEVAVTREIAAGEIAALNWWGPSLSVAMQLVWHKDKWISPAMHAFARMTREMLAVENKRGQ